MEPIKLRGPHLAVFANYIKGREMGFYPSKRVYDPLSELSILFAAYGLNDKPREISFAERLWGQFLENPSQEVEIVGGLDTICKNVCSPETQTLADCREDGEDSEDGITLKEYGLEVGQRVTAGQIAEAIGRYRTLTGYSSPREAEIRKLLDIRLTRWRRAIEPSSGQLGRGRTMSRT
jgi:hypothetical protein